MELVAPLINFNWTLLMVFITFLVLYLILKKLFFEKIHNFMQAREQKVRDQFENAEAATKLAEQHFAEYKEKLDNIEIERRDVLKEARTTAEQRAHEIIKEAKDHAAEIIRQAGQEAEKERLRLAEEMRREIAMLAMYAAEKIIEKELDDKEQMLFIDDIIKQKDGEKWKS